MARVTQKEEEGKASSLRGSPLANVLNNPSQLITFAHMKEPVSIAAKSVNGVDALSKFVNVNSC